jgi:hypothetical protein
VEAVNADLFDRDDVERKVGQIGGITHIVFGAYVKNRLPANEARRI